MRLPTIRQIIRLTNERWLNLFAAEVECRGERQSWFFASRKNREQRIERGELLRGDGVLVVALVRANKEYRLVVTQEFRPAIAGVEIGLPGGAIEPGETVIGAAARELRTKTGFKLKRLIHRSPPVVSTSSVCDEVNTIVWCEAEGQLSAGGRDTSECIAVKLVDLRQLETLMRSQEAFIAARLYCVAAAFMAAGKISPDVFTVRSDQRHECSDRETEVIPVEVGEADLFDRVNGVAV